MTKKHSSKIVTSDLQISTLTVDELKLISAFLCITVLSNHGSLYQDAANTLIAKIENLMGPSFFEHSHDAVQIKVNVLDQNSKIFQTFSAADIEIELTHI